MTTSKKETHNTDWTETHTQHEYVSSSKTLYGGIPSLFDVKEERLNWSIGIGRSYCLVASGMRVGGSIQPTIPGTNQPGVSQPGAPSLAWCQPYLNMKNLVPVLDTIRTHVCSDTKGSDQQFQAECGPWRFGVPHRGVW